jgi:5'-nucleotidase
MVQKLREEHKCDMIITLTHMMKYNDIKLAKNVKGIDLILGGHDHLVVNEQVKESTIIKSGCDFRHFSIIHVYKKDVSNKIE